MTVKVCHSSTVLGRAGVGIQQNKERKKAYGGSKTAIKMLLILLVLLCGCQVAKTRQGKSCAEDVILFRLKAVAKNCSPATIQCLHAFAPLFFSSLSPYKGSENAVAL